MGTIPEYFATQRVMPEQLPRASQQIVQAGQGIQAEAVTRVAAGISSQLARISQEHKLVDEKKQLARDKITLATIKGALDEFEYNSRPNPQDAKTIADFTTQEENYHKAWERKGQQLISGHNQDVVNAFTQYIESHRPLARKHYRDKKRVAERDWATASIEKEWINRLKGNIDNPVAARQQLITLINSYDAYLKPSEKQNLLSSVDKSIESAQIHKLINTDPASAFAAIDGAKTFEEAEKNTLRNRAEAAIASRQREESARLAKAREDTMNSLLANWFDGKLKDTSIVTSFLRAGLLDKEDAKYLNNAILNPKPPTHKLTAEAEVRQAIEDIGTNTKTKEDALKVLYSNVQNLDPTKGSSLLNEIFGEHDKNIAEIQRESRDIMEELIRDKYKFSGLFTDDERQIIAHSEAYLMLDAEIKKAAEQGKPLSRRDTLIKATQIGRQMKKKVKAEEEAKEEPVFEPDKKTKAEETEEFLERLEKEKYWPYKKGIPRNPQFELKDGEPEKVFNESGKEIGIKRKNGPVFRIGHQANIGGVVYEYRGSGNWEKIGIAK